MPIASYKDQNDNQGYFEQKDGREVNVPKTLAKIYGYMAIGLLITAAVAFFGAWFFSSHIRNASSLDVLDAWGYGYLGTLIVSGIVVLVMSFAIPAVMIKGRISIWPFYIIYSIAIGLLMTAFLLIGIDWYTIGEALAITSASFLVMFLIGWFSSAKINAIGYVLIMILSMALLFALVFFIVFAINGFTWGNYIVWNLVVCGIIVAITLITVAIDSHQIRRLLESGEKSKNVHLYCAFRMYTNFIVLLIRVIQILGISKRR